MLEYEIKLLLTREEYICLMEFFVQATSIPKQTNYYFDTDRFDMNRNNVTCRVRQKDGKYVGTVKKHVSGVISYETPVEIRNGLDDNIFIDLGMKLQGALYTNRARAFDGNGCVVVIDKNKYLGYTDYELEIEYEPKCEKCALEILCQCFDAIRSVDSSVTYTDFKNRIGIGKSKCQRFFKRKLSNTDSG